MSDRRGEGRGFVEISGTAVTGEGLIRIPLRIVNLSRTGAMVEVEDRAQLPRQFVLLFNRTAEPCRLIWQQGGVAGLQFIDMADLK